MTGPPCHNGGWGITELTKRRRVLLLAVTISVVVVFSLQAMSASLLVSNVEYGTSLVLVQGLVGGAIQGNNQGLIFYWTNATSGGVEGQLWTVNATDFKTKLVANFTQVDDGSVGYLLLDSKSNMYYTASLSNMTELIYKRLWASGTFASRQVIYKDNPCGVPEKASCTSGIGYGLAVAPDGTVYFAENFPSSGTPSGNGTSVIKEVPPGASRATTLLSIRGNNTIYEIALATKYLYFTYVTTTVTHLERFALSSKTYRSVANFSTRYVGLLNIVSSPPVNGVVKKLYYFYRLSKGPFGLLKKTPTSRPAAEGVVGVVPTNVERCNNSSATVSPCGLKAETLPSPRSFEFEYYQGALQVDGLGDVFQFVIPYATSPGMPTATIVLQWYNPSTGKFTELASEVASEVASSYTPTFTVDSSGNVYWLTSTGAIMEIPRV